MYTEINVENIYPQIAESIMLAHPKKDISYRMLSNMQLIDLANKSLDFMLEMGIQQIIVSESGAVPFAMICAWVGRKRNLPFTWYSVKIPRDISAAAEVTLQSYLSLNLKDLLLPVEFTKETTGFQFIKQATQNCLPKNYFDLQGRNLKAIFENIQENNHFQEQEYFLNFTKFSGLAQILNKPFIFFDEYIDSGKTLFQTFRFFKLFAKALNFKIFSYMIKLPKALINSNLGNSLYTTDNEETAYETGVYPFENRIDWLGYFYRSSSESFKRIVINDLVAEKANSSVNSLDKLLDIIKPHCHELLNEVRLHCSVNQVSSFITIEHIIQYAFYTLEKAYFGDTDFCELLYQLFDLYGPIWSPLPDEYHLSYLDAFNKINTSIENIFLHETIGEKYQMARKAMIQNITKLLAKRRLQYHQSLLKTLEKHYES